MCTIGAKILRPQHEFILFKNRDFGRTHFDDRISLTNDAFGVLGLETWAGDDPAQDRFSGFSIGFNAHLACCDANARGMPNSENYDRLVQAVVENCATIQQAVQWVQKLVDQQFYGWANLLIATRDGVAALEVRKYQVKVEYQPFMLARTNHHVLLGATLDDDDTVTSADRYAAVRDGIQTVGELDDVFPLLRSHHADSESGVCNHSLYRTVYSYVLHWNDGETTFYVHQGSPCRGGAYTRIPVQFGGATDLRPYPSAHVT